MIKKVVEIPISNFRIGTLIHQVSKMSLIDFHFMMVNKLETRVEYQIIWSLQTQTSVYKLTSAGRATGCATGVETQA